MEAIHAGSFAGFGEPAGPEGGAARIAPAAAPAVAPRGASTVQLARRSAATMSREILGTTFVTFSLVHFGRNEWYAAAFSKFELLVMRARISQPVPIRRHIRRAE